MAEAKRRSPLRAQRANRGDPERSINRRKKLQLQSDLRFTFGANNLLEPLHPNNQCQGFAYHLNLVIPSEAEGPAVPLGRKQLLEPSIRITNAKVRQPFKTLSSRAKPRTCSSLSVATTFRTLHPNNQRQGSPTILNLVHPERSRGTCSSLSVATTFRTPHPNNQMPRFANHLKPCHPERSPRDLQFTLGRNEARALNRPSPTLRCAAAHNLAGFPTSQHSPTITRAAFPRESRMVFANAAKLNRKSGGA